MTMAGNGRSASAERIRNLVLSLERLVAEGVASGVVRGAAGEVESIEGLDESLQALVENGVAVLGRLVEDAASRAPFPPGTWPQLVAAGAVKGALDELKTSMPLLNDTAQQVLGRLNLALERMAVQAEARASLERNPGAGARALAGGAVQGALDQVQAARAELTGVASELAFTAGRELANGFLQALSASLEEKGELRRTGRQVISGGASALRHLLRGPAAVIGGATLAFGVTALVVLARR